MVLLLSLNHQNLIEINRNLNLREKQFCFCMAKYIPRTTYPPACNNKTLNKIKLKKKKQKALETE